MATKTKLAVKGVEATDTAAEKWDDRCRRVAAKARAITAWWHATDAVVRRLSNDLDAITEELTGGDDCDNLQPLLDSSYFALLSASIDKVHTVLVNYNPAAASIPDPLPVDPAA